MSAMINCRACLNFPCHRVKEYMDNDDIVEADSIDIDVLIGFASNCTEADSPNSIECEYSDEEIEVENAPGK